MLQTWTGFRRKYLTSKKTAIYSLTEKQRNIYHIVMSYKPVVIQTLKTKMHVEYTQSIILYLNCSQIWFINHYCSCLAM